MRQLPAVDLVLLDGTAIEDGVDCGADLFESCGDGVCHARIMSRYAVFRRVGIMSGGKYDHWQSKEGRMNRICIVVLMAVLTCVPGCGPSEAERVKATEDLLSVYHDDSKSVTADDIRLLISKGANVNARSRSYLTPLMQAAYESNPEIIQVLIENGADLEARSGTKSTALKLAACFSKSPEVVQVLIDNGAEIESRDEYGRTPLMIRASYFSLGSPENIQVLLENGADIEARDHEGMTPLMRAASGNQPENIQVLLENGAQINARDTYNGTPLKHAIFQRREADIVQLLLDNGADIEERHNGGRTPLMLAAWTSTPEVVQLLLDNGADINARDNFGNTPLHYSILDYYDVDPEIITLLIKAGADVNARDNNGNTALMEIAAWKSVLNVPLPDKSEIRQIRQILIDAGAKE